MGAAAIFPKSCRRAHLRHVSRVGGGGGASVLVFWERSNKAVRVMYRGPSGGPHLPTGTNLWGGATRSDCVNTAQAIFFHLHAASAMFHFFFLKQRSIFSFGIFLVLKNMSERFENVFQVI